jgi:alkylation response protein AidB-like acyl-CoA dehydrogenase
VRVDGEATLGRPGAAVQVGVVESFGLGYAAVYVGIAESSLAFALDYLRKRVVKPENISVAQDPTVQRHIGELAVRLDAARLVLEQAAAGGEGADFLAERAFRDMRTATLMPPTVDRMLETIGKSALGLADGMFRLGGGPPGG